MFVQMEIKFHIQYDIVNPIQHWYPITSIHMQQYKFENIGCMYYIYIYIKFYPIISSMFEYLDILDQYHNLQYISEISINNIK